MARSKNGKWRKSRWFKITIAVILVAAVVVVWKMNSGKGDKPIIQTAKVDRGDIVASVSGNGVLQPITTVQVKSNVAGEIMKLYVDEGDYVEAGQMIAEIDPTDPLTNLAQAQADLSSAEARVNQTRQGLTLQQLQTVANIQSAQQALETSKQRLLQAQAQAKVQPALSSQAIKQAQSSLAAAQTNLKQITSAGTPQKAAAARAAYDQAKAVADQASKELVRNKALLAKGYVSQSQVDAAQEQADSAEAQLTNARSRLDTVQAETDLDRRSAEAQVAQAKASLETAKANQVQVSLKKQDLKAAQAAVNQAQAQLNSARAAAYQNQMKQEDITQAMAQLQRAKAAQENAQKQVTYTKIVAPRSGVVVKKYVDPGSIVSAGRSSFAGSGSGVGLVDIADITRMYALVNVDETDIAQIESGQEVDITADAYPDELFTGKVTKIAPQAVVDQSVTTVPVTIELDAPDKRLRPNMNVTCEFITGRATNVVKVPNEAVKDNDGETTVTVMENKKQVVKLVEVGLVGPDETEIKSGLAEGEEVVTAVIGKTKLQMPRGMGGPGMGGPPPGPPPR